MKKIFIVSAVLLASIIIVRAEGITYPVQELGNCADKAACKAYCDETANMDACIKFAQAHGLMNKSEADTARNFNAEIVSGKGPGGCQGLKECMDFCSAVANLKTCLAFAEKQGLSGGNVTEGEKILKFLKAGGSLPGGCASNDSCAQYCGDFLHAGECVAFSLKAGIMQAGRGVDKKATTTPQFAKFVEAAKNGGPGGCKNKNECGDYCRDAAHRQECLDFAVKAGILSGAEANNIKISGATGPGGCASGVSCEIYCNNPANKAECFKFAENNGYLTQAEVDAAKNGDVSLHAGVEQASSEVRACLKSILGENIIGRIQSGNFVPGPDVGVQIKACFEKFGKEGTPAELLKSAPSGVNACLKTKLGTIVLNKLKAGTSQVTPEMADTVRVCFQANNINIPLAGAAADALRNFLKTAPSGILPCIKATLGADFGKISAGEKVPLDGYVPNIKLCFDQFRPQIPGTTPYVGGSSPAGGEPTAPTPVPSHTPTPIPTATPYPTITILPTPTPTSFVTPTPTPIPTATPYPTITILPTPTPTSFATPTPTPTATPTPTPTPTPTSTGIVPPPPPPPPPA